MDRDGADTGVLVLKRQGATVGRLDYHLTDDVIYVDFVEVSPAERGRGSASGWWTRPRTGPANRRGPWCRSAATPGACWRRTRSIATCSPQTSVARHAGRPAPQPAAGQVPATIARSAEGGVLAAAAGKAVPVGDWLNLLLFAVLAIVAVGATILWVAAVRWDAATASARTRAAVVATGARRSHLLGASARRPSTSGRPLLPHRAPGRTVDRHATPA